MTIASTSTNGSLNGSHGSGGGSGAQIGTKTAASVDPLRVLRKYKFAFVIAAVVGGVLGAGAHFALAEFRPTWSTPVIYKCYPPQTRPNPEQMNIDDDEFERFMATEAAMMVSENVLRQAVENPRLLNEAPKWISRHTTGGVVNVGQAVLDLEEQVGARVMAGTDLIRMTVSWRDRQEVATLAEVVNAAYLQDLRRRGSRSTTERREAIEQAIVGLETDFNQSDRRRNEIVSSRKMDVLDINQSQERAEMMIVLGSMQELGLQLEALLAQKAEMEAQLRNPGGLQFNDTLRAQVELQPLIQNLRSQVVFLQAQRATERERLAEDNPVIRRIDDQIAALERSLDQQRQELMEELFQTQLDQLRLGEQQLRAQMARLVERRTALGVRLQELVYAETELSDIERRMEQILELQQEFETDLRMLDATSQMTTASRVDVIQSPRVPTQMAFPKIYILVPAGMIVVVGLVAGGAYLLEMVDQRVKSPADIAALPSVRILGMVPHVTEDPARIDTPERVFAEQPLTAMSESYRQVRGAVLKRMRAGGHKSLLVVPAMPGSGATTVVSNLAESLAAADNRVIVIDTNIRRPRLHEVFGLPMGPGVGEVLAGAALSDVAQQTGNPNLRVITCGEPGNRQLEALATGAIVKLIKQATAEADFVILDVSPATVSGDAQALAQVVDATMLVAKAFGETRGQIGRLSRELDEQPARYLGVLVNAARNASGGYLRGNLRAGHSYTAKAKTPAKS
ncbi:hypothetical protein AY599_05445 [Leptolyngbya valderiana BDU 20041]|nr:hypothetical protein AY599_05445 [Leptolyngbya valderiana BDU 20041]